MSSRPREHPSYPHMLLNLSCLKYKDDIYRKPRLQQLLQALLPPLRPAGDVTGMHKYSLSVGFVSFSRFVGNMLIFVIIILKLSHRATIYTGYFFTTTIANASKVDMDRSEDRQSTRRHSSPGTVRHSTSYNTGYQDGYLTGYQTGYQGVSRSHQDESAGYQDVSMGNQDESADQQDEGSSSTSGIWNEGTFRANTSCFLRNDPDILATARRFRRGDQRTERLHFNVVSALQAVIVINSLYLNSLTV